MTKPCKYCASSQHTSLMCFKRPRMPIVSKKKTINRLGKVAAKWIETRHDWIQKNTTLSGTWRCYICGDLLTRDTLTLDHIKSRSRHPELRYEHTNLAPCCYACNKRKGSRDLTELER